MARRTLPHHLSSRQHKKIIYIVTKSSLCNLCRLLFCLPHRPPTGHAIYASWYSVGVIQFSLIW